ncbi:hypothetical protein FHR90_001399 [Endobacter medicaginis]|uniref:Dipeptidyl-peptidase n=1 Tax=Endobacter medicaginis TaxID=1181271 RepID=A0A850NR55_9PROT|nr:S46 family peptidase [Endobacter medicaginis]MBB3173576.1 hypothetical protein [Endobacter medicaginis]MCX5475790.1 S46 family peptidase [Endobacter medicaginis]NVN29715.1 S46 family peptidase [Endobacter medicaginis]
MRVLSFGAVVPLLAATALSAVSAVPALGEEGMWTMDHLPLSQLRDKYHFEPSAAWIERVTRASARLALGCSASFVSADGLVMTNHHCANECLSELSGPGRNYMADGYRAAGQASEPKCPAMELDQLYAITDVTDRMNDATKGHEGADYNHAQHAAESAIEHECIGGDATTWRCDVVSLYHGGRYALYRYKRYQDVRLVFAPDQQIAFFGGDPDNFNFPRYDLDVTFLRAYENGRPAATPDFLPFDVNGPKAGELVFTSGNPGSTSRETPVASLRFLHDVVLPLTLSRLSALDGLLWEYSRQGGEQARQAEEVWFGVQNGLKVYRGWMQTLADPAVLAGKAKAEAELKDWIDADPARQKQFGDPWAQIDRAIETQRKLFTRFTYIEGTRSPAGFDSDLFGYARMLVRAASQSGKPDAERLPAFRDARLPALKAALGSSAPVHPQFDATTLAFSLTGLRQALTADDPFVHEVLGKQSPDEVAHALVSGSKLGDPAVRMALYKGGSAAIEASTDPMIVLARRIDPEALALRKQYEDQVVAPLAKASEAIARARFAKDGANSYPDATFTQRLSYGTVKGWNENGREIAPFTDFAGLYARATGSEPFRLPKVWLDAKPRLDLKTKFDFATTNDIIGGNSGSPVLDRDGHAVGLIFDGNIHSLGGDFLYDPELNRAVAVDTTALYTAVKDVYGLPALAEELRAGKLPASK